MLFNVTPSQDSLKDLEYIIHSVKQDLLPRNSYSIDFTVPSTNLYGLPERRGSMKLSQDSYRIYAVDRFSNITNDKSTRYSAMPYVTAHTKEYDQSIVWITASETKVDIKFNRNESNLVFATESGKLEFYLISSTKGPKQISKKLAQLTGFPILPPFYAMGFHYSKWESTSADRIIEYSKNFEQSGFPLDSLWLDIGYTDKGRYFKFDRERFPLDKVKHMNELLDFQGRRIVAIVDPHVKIDSPISFVQRIGLEMERDNPGKANAFVKVKNQRENFMGESWPGKCYWFDYFNEHAINLWGRLFKEQYFVGSNEKFGAWLDMNEPSVFKKYDQTLPKYAVHKGLNGKTTYHRDVHNAYGYQMTKSTYQIF